MCLTAVLSARPCGISIIVAGRDDSMEITIRETTEQMAVAAAECAAREISRFIHENGRAAVMVATGASQIAFLLALTKRKDIEWARIAVYHLDEFVGIPPTHPASFRRYVRERFTDIVKPAAVCLIDGNAPDLDMECRRYANLLPPDGIDVNFVGIGENAHIGFNDPPADFHAKESFVVAELAESARRQQHREGWFPTLEDVPQRAISITVPAIMKSKCIVSVVPDARKADAVKCALIGPVCPACPASILRNHPNVHLFLDAPAASLVERSALTNYQLK